MRKAVYTLATTRSLRAFMLALATTAATALLGAGATLAAADDSAQRAALDDLNQQLSAARAVPNFENGQPAGYTVVNESGEVRSEKLELRNGEVLSAPNPNAEQPEQQQAQPDGLR